MTHVKPGIPAAAVVRTVTATNTVPNGPAPLDTTPTGDAGAGGTESGTDGESAGGESSTGQAPVAGEQGRSADADLILPPAGAPGGSGDLAPGGGASEGAKQQQAAVAAAAGRTPIESLPTDVQTLIAGLRKEASENRVKAKTAAEAAVTEAETRLHEKQQEWVGNLLKAAGLMPDAADQAAAELTPEQQVQALTEQLGQRDADVTAREQKYRDTAHELALWKGAAAHGADPQRLADSVSFMRTVGALDPSASDYADQVSAAIATAVGDNEHFKVPAPAAPALPPAPPAVASGADGFAGGPRGGASDQPRGIEAHRAALREKRGR